MPDVSTRAYIAGFLDGDGSIIFQLVRRRDYRLGFQIRASVCFYQNKRGIEGLCWLRERLGGGSIRERSGQMSDLAIVGVEPVEQILKMVRPYVVFKRRQVEFGLQLLTKLREIPPGDLDAFQNVAEMVDRFAVCNYSKNRTNTAQVVREHLSSVHPFHASLCVYATTCSHDHYLVTRLNTDRL